ncbi:MAG TPA: tRNA (adenosine(37)-N6)-threonylcarbamoyltransferase complex transferase subunit TsaD [Kiritimatiellia bacterium]|nr:tRNA (adenosine(37)-N6)-threonylcarbamoyltransferase complex transferase subunit TsaD [Kiritimatiellia bacterium]
MLVLGIESSCDETAAAVVRGGREVLSSVVNSQIASHRPYGGVVPEIASREHVGNFPVVAAEAVARAGVAWEALDAIAVTHGPGLVSSLLIGLSGARALGQALGKPVWGVNHLEAHVAGMFLDPAAPAPAEACPALVLMVSGGHSCLVEMLGVGRFRLLGQTLDDAAGECLDKGANLLGLGYPGGPVIERAAQGGDPTFVKFPRGMEHAKNRTTDNGLEIEMCFSFSGLKTALLYHLKNHPEDRARHLADLAASYQEAVMDSLALRAERALANTGARTLACVGGVAKNASLRGKLEALARRRRARLLLTPLAYCTDNAAMVAAAAGLRAGAGLANPPAVEADPSLPLVEEPDERA